MQKFSYRLLYVGTAPHYPGTYVGHRLIEFDKFCKDAEGAQRQAAEVSEEEGAFLTSRWPEMFRWAPGVGYSWESVTQLIHRVDRIEEILLSLGMLHAPEPELATVNRGGRPRKH